MPTGTQILSRKNLFDFIARKRFVFEQAVRKFLQVVALFHKDRLGRVPALLDNPARLFLNEPLGFFARRIALTHAAGNHFPIVRVAYISEQRRHSVLGHHLAGNAGCLL